MQYQEYRRIHTPQINKRQTFGIIHRDPQPSMFDLLTWNVDQVQKRIPRKTNYHQENPLEQQNIPINTPIVIQVKPMQHLVSQHVITSVKSVPQLSYIREKPKIQKPITNKLYQYQDVVPVIKKKKQGQDNNKDSTSKRPNSNYNPKRYTKNLVNDKINKKPPFATYGRGNTNTQFDYMKSHNVIPHSGKNKPEQNQTYQSALLIASKHQISSIDNIEDEAKNVVHLKLSDKNKTRTILSAKHLQNSTNKNRKYQKQEFDDSNQYYQLEAKKVIKQRPLKFMNQREDFIQRQREQEVKKNRYTLKPTECYPGEYSVKSIDLAESHSSHAIPAGKRNPVHQDIRQLMTSATNIKI